MIERHCNDFHHTGVEMGTQRGDDLPWITQLLSGRAAAVSVFLTTLQCCHTS